MKYRRLGNTGLKVSEIGLGSWLTYGTAAEQKAADECVAAAFECGINFLTQLMPITAVKGKSNRGSTPAV